MSEVVLLLRNTDSFQQVEDYVRGCSTSTKYWQHSSSWRLFQRLFYFYEKLKAFNKLKIMSDVILLLQNTDNLQQVEDYVRCQRLFYFYEILTTFNKLKIMSEVVISNLSRSWRLCQMLFYFYETLTTFNKLKIMSYIVLLLRITDNLQQVEYYVRGCFTSPKYWQPSTSCHK